jgi:hypothetical protein
MNRWRYSKPHLAVKIGDYSRAALKRTKMGEKMITVKKIYSAVISSRHKIPGLRPPAAKSHINWREHNEHHCFWQSISVGQAMSDFYLRASSDFVRLSLTY